MTFDKRRVGNLIPLTLDGRTDREVLLDSEFGRHIVAEATGESDGVAVQNYLALEASGRVSASACFDPGFVQRYYPLSLRPGESPLAFVCRHSDRPWCYVSPGAVAPDADIVRDSALFDEAAVSAALLVPGSRIDVATYYCTEGYRLMVDPSNRFSLAAYIIQNQDLAETGVNGLLHYECHGRAEGRPAQSTAEIAEQPFFYMLDGLSEVSSPESDAILVNCNQGGLMNRLIPMLSLVDQAERCGRRPAIWWTPNSHCAAHFEDIFDIAASGIIPASVAALSDRPASAWINRIENGGTPPLPESLLAATGIIHSVTPWSFEGSPIPSYTRLAEIFGRATLAPSIRAKLARFDGVDFTNMIGLHVRRAYPSGAFSELEQSKFGLDLGVYERFVTWLRAAFPDLGGICLCTNSGDAELSLRASLGEVLVFDKESFDNTSDAVAVQDAFVDLLLMSRCRFVISQATTSFGFFASVIGRGNLLSIIGEDAEQRTMFIVSRYGDRLADLPMGDEAVAQLRALLPDA